MYNLIKKTFNVACLSLLSSINYTSAIELNSETIPRYVDNTVEQLVGINNKSEWRAQLDKSSIKYYAIKASIEPTQAEREYPLGVERTADQVQNNVYSSIIDFVEKQSYRIAFEKTNNDRVAHRIAKTLRDSIEKQIIQTNEFLPGALSGFVGNALHQKVNEQCNRFDIVYDTTSAPVECPICWETFIKPACVALYPCGHYVCKNCAHEFFLVRQGMPRCPQCIRLINLTNLRKKLYEPSAPPMD